jgi:hypothetical protein
MQVARQAGQKTWVIFGELVAHRTTSMNEATKRCLYWRDAGVEVLSESATELEIEPDVLAQGMNILA